MNRALLRLNIKNNRFLWSIMTLVFCFYLAIIMVMYNPTTTDALDDMLEMLPQALVRAMNFQNVGASLLTFIAGYIYGFLIFMFPMVLSIVVNHRLVGSLVDKGSLAFLLATPHSRNKLAQSQALFSLLSITGLFTVSSIFSLIYAAILFPGQLEIGKFILLNLYALSMYYAIGGIGFLSSCLASEGKNSLALGIGIPMTFLVLQMLGSVSDQYAWIGNLSLYALFDPDKLIAGDPFVYTAMGVFLLLAILLYTSGIFVFKKRNFYV